MKKVVGYLSIAIAVAFISLAAITLIAPRFGWKVDVVMSGSMEPRLKSGSVVVTRPMGIADINSGDIITFHSPLNGRLTTHRVIYVVNEPSIVLRTKGDASEDADPFVVGSQNLVGKVCFNMPYLGYATQFIKSRLGILLALFLPGLIIVVMEMMNIRRVIAQEQLAKQHVLR